MSIADEDAIGDVVRMLSVVGVWVAASIAALIVASPVAWADAWVAAQSDACDVHAGGAAAAAAALSAAWIGCSVPAAVVVGSFGMQSSEIRECWTYGTCPHDDPLVLLRGQKCLFRCLHGGRRYHYRASSAPIYRPV